MPWKDPEKTKAAGKRWYEANKEKKAAQDKRRQNTPEFKKANRVRALAYYHANRDKVLSYKKKFHAANLESQRARMRNRVISPEQRNRYNAQARAAQRWQHPDIAARRAEYYQKNKEKARLRIAARRLSDPEAYSAGRSARWHKRRAILAGLTEHFTNKEWLALKKEYHNHCLRCRRCEPSIKLTADHVLPLSKGGGNSISNIQPLCGDCNCWKGRKHIDFRPHSEASTTISRRASAYHPGPADELNMMLPFTAESASL